MGILSRLFAANPAKNSYVRRWLAGERQKGRDEDDVFACFVDFLEAASRFGQKEGVQDERPSAVAGQYAGDASIFEVVCYTCFCLQTAPAGGQPELVQKFAVWINEIFAVAWDRREEYIGGLVDDRFAAYRAAAGDRARLERLLAGRLLATKGGRLPEKGHEEPPAGEEGDFPFIMASIEAYEAEEMPAVIEAARAHGYRQEAGSGGVAGGGGEVPAGQEQRDYLLAMALLAQKDYVRAAKAFTKVLDANPENYNALLERGRIRFLLRQPLEAIEDLSAAIAIAPGDWRAYLERGQCYHRALRMADKAKADYDRAIALAPGSGAGYLARGSLFDDLDRALEKQAADNGDREKASQLTGEFQAAIDDYTRAIDLSPDDDEAYVGRGLACARKALARSDGAYASRAIADLERAMALNWENGYLYKTAEDLGRLVQETVEV